MAVGGDGLGFSSDAAIAVTVIAEATRISIPFSIS